MKYLKGNIIDVANAGGYDILVHGCNCFNTMGAGVAKAIADAWPEVYEADRLTEKGSIDKLGYYSSAYVKGGAHRFNVVNAYTQYRYYKDPMPFEYGALNQVFGRLRGAFPNSKYLIPKIGAGLARGDWTLIEKIINRYSLDVTCCVLEE